MAKIIAVKSKDDQWLEQLLRALPSDYEVVVEPDMNAALRTLYADGAAALIADRESIPAPREHITAIDPEHVLDAIHEGVMVLDHDLRIIWANKVLRQTSQVGDQVVGVPCYRVFHGRSDACLGCEGSETFRTGRQAKRVQQAPDGTYQESVSSPVFDELGRVIEVVVVTRDVSERVFLQSRIESIYQAGNNLASLDWTQMSQMSIEDRIEHIKRSVISHTARLLKFDSLVIRQLDDRTGELKPIIWVGCSQEEEDILKQRKVLSKREGFGISGYVAATGRSYLCRDATTDSLISSPTTEFGSQITVPLRLNDRVIGTMGVRSKRSWAYSVDDMKFLEIFGNFVAIALNTANLIRLEHAVTYGRVAELIANEISNPVNAVVNDVYLLLQEYIGHDSNTIAKLRDIEHNIERVKDVVKRITDEGRPATPAIPREEDDLFKGKRILVADDDEAIRQTMSEILMNDGCIVESAADGQEVLDMLQSRTYDLLLSDIKMPKRNGYEIYSVVREKFPNMPVILMTAFGYDPNHSIVQARQKGLETVLFKPFKVTTLRREIRKALEAGAAANKPS